MTTTTTRALEEKKRQDAFNITLRRIAGAWKRAGDGFDLQALKKHAKDANALLELTEWRLNNAWKTAQQGLITEDEFAAALNNWETENYKAIAALKAVL